MKDVTSNGFTAEVIERSHDLPVVVDFWAAWCGPCKTLGPILERLAEESDTWELAKVDVDANPEVAGQFGIQGIPTVIAFKDGKPVSRFTGALAETQVREFLSQLQPTELDLRAGAADDAYGVGDTETAERLWTEVLATDPGHESAGVGLAGLLLERGEAESALKILERLAPTEGVRQLQAAARLSQTGSSTDLREAAESGDPQSILAYGRALAAESRYEESLERLIDLVAMKLEGVSEEARVQALDIFELLGPDHPLTVEYRKRLASALF